MTLSLYAMETVPMSASNTTTPNMIILYVDSPERSAAFYGPLLQRDVLEQSPTFALFLFEGGFKLGFWARAGVEPASAAAAGAGEVGLPVASDAEVLRLHREWVERGVRIAQAPTRMDFGYTFVGLDPDGHRLRVFCLSE